MNLGHLDFDFVSDFVLRISNFASLGPLHLSRTLYKLALFMQNKPKFRKSQMNVNKVLTMNYEKKDTWWAGKKRTQTNPIQTQTNPTPQRLKSAQISIIQRDIAVRPPSGGRKTNPIWKQPTSFKNWLRNELFIAFRRTVW